MSHVVQLGLQVKDLDALKATCAALGLELVLGQKQFKYFANQSTPCDHAIRIPENSLAYEIGVSWNQDHFDLQWDTYSGGEGMVSYVSDGKGANANKLKQMYGLQVGIADLQAQGYQVSQYTLADGSIVLEGVQ